MRKLRSSDKNTPEDYNEIYWARDAKGVDWADERRWELIAGKVIGGVVLDLGCLDSQVPILVKDATPGVEVWGLDQAVSAIEAQRERYPHINWVVGDAYRTPFRDCYFDGIVMGELVEHLEEPFLAVGEAFRILKSGGVLVLSTPLEETEAGEVDHERHLWSFTEESIRNLLEAYGDVTTEVLRSVHEPEYKYAFPTLVATCIKR